MIGSGLAVRRLAAGASRAGLKRSAPFSSASAPSTPPIPSTATPEERVRAFLDANAPLTSAKDRGGDKSVATGQAGRGAVDGSVHTALRSQLEEFRRLRNRRQWRSARCALVTLLTSSRYSM